MLQQQPASQGWTPTVTGVLALTVLVVYSLTFAAVLGDGYLYSKETRDNDYRSVGISLFNDQMKDVADAFKLLPHLRATQAIAALSLAVFAAAFFSCIVDYRPDVITKRSAGLHFFTSMFLTLTWVLEVTLFTRESGEDWSSAKLEDVTVLGWGFAVVVGASVITAVLGGVSAYYSMSQGASYVPQGQMMQSAVPMQGYVPPQMQPMQPMGMQPAMVPAYQPVGQQQMMQTQAMPMNVQQPVHTMQPMATQQQQANMGDASLAE